LGGTAEGGFAVDVPVLVEGGGEPFFQGGALIQVLELAVELELSVAEELAEAVAEFGAVDAGQGVDVEEELGIGVFPLGAIQGNAATGDDDVQVVVIQQGLAPGMEDGGEADLGSQVVAAELQQSLADGLEEEGVEGLAILAEEGIEFMGQGEDEMEVGDGQEVLALAFQPVAGVGALAGGAVAVAAGVGNEVFLAAFGAAVAVAAERVGATLHEGVEDAPVMGGQLGIARGHGPAQDLAQSGAGGHGSGPGGGDGGEVDEIQRTLDLGDPLPAYVEVEGGGLEAGMSEQLLHDGQFDAGFQ
jgi:hypothetical protein